MEDGVKAPSEAPLYDVAAAYVVFRRGALRDAGTSYPEVLDAARSEATRTPRDAPPGGPPESESDGPPRFLVLTMNAPLDAPSLTGYKPDSNCGVFS